MAIPSGTYFVTCADSDPQAQVAFAFGWAAGYDEWAWYANAKNLPEDRRKITFTYHEGSGYSISSTLGNGTARRALNPNHNTLPATHARYLHYDPIQTYPDGRDNVYKYWKVRHVGNGEFTIGNEAGIVTRDGVLFTEAAWAGWGKGNAACVLTPGSPSTAQKWFFYSVDKPSVRFNPVPLQPPACQCDE